MCAGMTPLTQQFEKIEVQLGKKNWHTLEAKFNFPTHVTRQQIRGFPSFFQFFRTVFWKTFCVVDFSDFSKDISELP